jgi:uncharacterized protein (TIGR03067 family)
MRCLFFTMMALAIIVPSLSAGDDAQEKELKILAGLWSAHIKVPVSGLAPEVGKSPYLNFDLKADGTAKVNGVDNQAKVTLNPAKKPKTIDIEYTGGPLKGKKQFGIYDFKKGKNKEHDTWIMVVADINTKAADRPTDLAKAKGNSTRYVFGRSYLRTIE